MMEFHVSIMEMFSRVVGDFMQTQPPSVTAFTSCGEALRIMRELPASSIVVTSDGGQPVGIITEQDVVRRIAFVNSEDTRVSQVMSSPVSVIHADDYIFKGIATMQKYGLRHLPVTGRDGVLAGMLSLQDALAGASANFMNLIVRLMHDETPEGLRLVKNAGVEVADALIRDHIPATEIQTLLTHINNDIYRRVQALIVNDLEEEGWGRPPVEFDLIVMGSGGRGESFLFPDQDCGFILTDYPDRQHTVIDAFFIELAERMSSLLDQVGIPRCKGNVMALNPTWRKSISQWKAQIDFWLERPGNTTLRYIDIFFDFRYVAGPGEHAGHLRRYISGIVKQNHVFLREMQKVYQDHRVALTLRGGLMTEHDPLHKGEINLKYNGLLPLVESVRLLALREGVSRTSTMARIKSLYNSGILGCDEMNSLNSAYNILTTLILHQQINDYKNGMPVTTYLKTDYLSRGEKADLTGALRAIRGLQERVHSEFTGEIF